MNSYYYKYSPRCSYNSYDDDDDDYYDDAYDEFYGYYKRVDRQVLLDYLYSKYLNRLVSSQSHIKPDSPVSSKLQKPQQTQKESIKNNCDQRKSVTPINKVLQKKDVNPEPAEPITRTVESNQENDKTICQICFENHVFFLFDPCGHFICNDCQMKRNQTDSCPFCVTTIQKKIKVHFI